MGSQLTVCLHWRLWPWRAHCHGRPGADTHQAAGALPCLGTHTQINMCMCILDIYTHMCIFIFKQICVHFKIYKHMYTYMCVSVTTCIYIWVHIYLYICIYIFIDIYVYIPKHMYEHIVWTWIWYLFLTHISRHLVGVHVLCTHAHKCKYEYIYIYTCFYRHTCLYFKTYVWTYCMDMHLIFDLTNISMHLVGVHVFCTQAHKCNYEYKCIYIYTSLSTFMFLFQNICMNLLYGHEFDILSYKHISAFGRCTCVMHTCT